MSSVSNTIVRAWYQGAFWLYLLFPLALLYWLVITCRKFAYRQGLKSSYRSSLPVVVVGNVTVGGTGKSPLVTYLVGELRAKGFNPGVVSRGYGAEIPRDSAVEVTNDSLASEVGDEPLMLKRKLGCLVVVCPTRALAIQKLEELGCDIVISDDGMQHYAMARDIEICVFDAQRQLGNGLLMPMGPLRETKNRLQDVDLFVSNGQAGTTGAITAYLSKAGQKDSQSRLFTMQLVPTNLVSLLDGAIKPADGLKNQRIHGVAAIGHPERFFKTLASFGSDVIPHAFPDHHKFTEQDFDFAQGVRSHDQPIIMTEKDAVKCATLNLRNAWYLPVSAQFDKDLAEAIIAQLKTKGFFNG